MRRLLLVGLAAAPPLGLSAQGWTASLLVQPYPSAFIADWQRNPQTAVLTLLYSGTGPQSYRVQGVVTSPTRGELARVISPPLTLGSGPVTQIFTSADILDWATVYKNQQYIDVATRTGQIPEGPLQICTTVLDLKGATLASACATVTIVLPDPPQLIFPLNAGVIAVAQPVFQWTPVLLPPELGASYRIKIVEVYPGQNPATAMAANPTWYQSDISGPPVLVYPLDGLPLDPAKQYAWQVQALDGSGNPVTRGGSASEIWIFAPGGPGSGGGGTVAALPDTVELIPGMARLTGLKTADVQTTDQTYTVNGPVVLELAAPFPARLRVDAQDLALDRASVAAGGALVKSGTVHGTVGTGVVPASLSGPSVTFSSIDYAAGSGLTLGAQLTLPGANGAADLTGTVQVTAAGLYGTLTAQSAAGGALLSVGQDPALLRITQARVTLPGGAVTLSGALDLFGQDVGCGAVNASFATDGTLSANVACLPANPIPLGPGGSRAQLTLHSVTGSFTGGSPPAYHLTASAELRLDAGTTSIFGTQSAATANCGGTFSLDVSAGAVTPSAFAARCDAGEGDAVLGWLHARLSSLALQRFSYAAGKGFDFALTVDLAPWIPAVSGLNLPTSASVTITPGGLGIPALDVGLTQQPFRLAGFGLRVTHVRLPAFTLSWADWSAGSASGFKYSVDAEVSFPDLPVGTSGCLANQTIAISGATIANGAFKAHLGEKTLSPPCAFTLHLANQTPDSASLPADTGAANSYQGQQQSVGQTPTPGSPIPSWPSNPADSAALKHKELAQMDSAENAYRAGLNNPKCDTACQRILKHSYDSLQDTTFKLWSARTFGAVQAKWGTCLAEERQRELMGMNDSGSTAPPPQNCSNLPNVDSAVKVFIAKIPLPPAKVDCDNEARWDAQVVIGAERQRQLSGDTADLGVSDPTGPLMAYCSQQVVNQLLATCRDSTTTRALRNYDAVAVLGAARQALLMGDTTNTALTSSTPVTFDQCDAMGKGPAKGSGPPYEDPPPPTAGTARTARAAPDTTSATPPDSGSGNGLTLEITGFGGDLAVAFAPDLVVQETPTIEGAIILPPIFTCSDTSQRQEPLQSKLRFGPHGEVDGTIQGFVPSCPINLAAVQVTVTQADLTFSSAPGAQSIVLSAAAAAKFTLTTTPVTGQGSVSIDLLHGRLLSGSLAFPGPIQFDLPRQSPVLSFQLPSLALDAGGIHVDGRAQLQLAGAPPIGATFDHLTINPQTVSVTSGQVLFDSAFALQIGVGGDGSLAWGAVPRGAPLTVSTGIRIDLPSQIGLSAAGFSASGDGGAHLVFGGKDVDSLTTKFSTGFSLALGPPAVKQGSVDIERQGVSLAYIDASGFHPNIAYFAGAALPAQLPVPTASVAYLELRDAQGNLRVSTQNTGNGIRIYTAPGATVPLVLPGLQLGQPTAPRLDVTFDLTLDPLGQGVALGSIAATVPAGSQDAFDFSSQGLPLALESLGYQKGSGGTYQWSLSGALMLFGQREEPGSGAQVQLTLDGTGRLTGTVSLDATQSIPLVPGSQKITLTLQHVDGAFNADFPSRNLQFQLNVKGGIDLALGSAQDYQVGAAIAVSDRGVQVTDLTYPGGDTPQYLDLSAFQLGVQHLRIPQLSYSPQSGFTFQMLCDVLLKFPSLGTTLPPIQDVSLSNSGFSLPEYQVPDLNLAVSPISGFNATLLAFRMSPVSYNWFTGQAPTDWGFGFDLELGFGTLMTGIPAELANAKIRLLNAGLHNGRLSGTLERVTFGTPINLGIGQLTALSGQMPSDGTPFSLTADFDLDLSAVLPVCPGASLKKTGNELSITSSGWVSGTLSGIVPTCSGNLGPFTFAFGQSEITFGSTGSGATLARSIQVALAATVKFPGVNPGDSVSASGTIDVDALQGRWLSGSISLTQPFRYQPPDGNPYLGFTVSQATLDQGGLHFTGQGSLGTKDGAQVTAQFNAFTLSLPDLKVTSGSVTFLSQFALGVGINNGSLDWGVYSVNAPRPSGPSFRAVVPDTVTLDAQGLYLGGTATASLAYGDTSFGALQVAFQGGFRVGFTPLAVSAGKATFTLGTDEIAHVDPSGFWPGNVFGVLPIPDQLGLPSTDVAYLQLRDQSHNLLIETQTSATGIELKTKPGQMISLVVPGLAASGGAAPAVQVSFDVVVNPGNLQLVSGSVHAQADPNAPALLTLDQLGIPLTIRSISYDKVGAAYGLTLAARIALPASLDGLNVDIPNLTLTAHGLSGEVRLGSYIQGNTSTQPIASQSFLNDTLVVAVDGALLQFNTGGGTGSFALKGHLSSALFAPDGQAPVPVPWTGSASAQGFSFGVDASQGLPTLPIAVAQFAPQAIGSSPAFQLTADAQQFTLTLSGVLTVPSISPTLSVSIAGLKVGTRGVVFPTVAVQGLGQQQLQIFGATFALADSTAGGTTVYPAIAFGSDQGALSLTLSGDVTFLGNTSRFYGFKVSTRGQISLAGASLISKPIVLVDSMLSVDDLLIQNNALRTDISVTLPEPLNSGGPQKANFSIDAQGHVSGGATIAVIDEPEGLTGSSSTHFTLGSVATVHLRYLGLTLDFANLKANSSVQVVTDLYLENQEDNRISLGDVTGGAVQPGLQIGFDGSVRWGNLTIAKEFSFDFDVLKIDVTNVSFPAQQSGFAVSLSGGLGLNVEDVSGSVNYHGFVITSKGDVQFPPDGVDGGSFTVANEITLAVSGFGYSPSPASLTLVSATPPSGTQVGKADTTVVNVQSYLTFGGSFSVENNEVAGGVDRFLFYRATDNSIHLVIQNAAVKIEDLADLHLDLTYTHTATGFQLAVGGQGKIYQYDGVVVGAIEKDGNTASRMGIFLAANGLNINITPYIRLDGAGGGFFLHPRPEWIDLVRSVAGVAQTGGMTIRADTTRFAVMMYGKVSFLQGVITGTSLTTISTSQILMDGTVVILGQDGHLTGNHHLGIGLHSLSAVGNMDFNVNYDGVVTGSGPVSFYVYSDTAWAVFGSSTINIVNYIKGTSDFFVGPPGFYLKSHVGASYDISLLTINGSIDAQVWYEGKNNTWGGYTSLGVSASVLGGLASATGTLQGALILTDGTPYIFAAADLQASIVGQSWQGWVWAKFQNGQASAGLGADQSILDAIAEAKSVADSMNAAKQETQNALAAVSSVTPGVVALTNQELVTAYQHITGGLNSVWMILNLAGMNTLESQYAPQPGESDYRSKYLGVLTLQNAPGDTTLIRQLTDSVTRTISALQGSQTQVQSRISALAMSIQPPAQNAGTLGVPGGSPVTSVTFASLDTLNATGGPSFTVDESAAQNQRSALSQARQRADAMDLAVRQQIAAVESGLGTVQSATTSGDPAGLPALVGAYAAVESQAEHQFAAQTDLLLRRRDWYHAYLDSLGSNQGAWNSDWIKAKDAALGSNHRSAALKFVDSSRVVILGNYAGVDLVGAFEDSLTVNAQNPWPFLQAQGDSAGRQLWFEMAWSGMQNALANTTTQFTQTQQAATQRLAAIRSGHAALSGSLASLYAVQARATGVLYDLYDRYLRARMTDTVPAQPAASGMPPSLGKTTPGGKQVVSTVDALLDITYLQTRRAELAQDLTVPRISSVQVVPVTSDRYSAQLLFTWSGWHPSGVYEFEFADADPTATAPSLYSNGASGSLASYRFTPDPTAATTVSRTFLAGVRGGAGYLGVGRTSYALSFSPASTQNASVSGGSSTTVDNTPPSTPVVTFPGLGEHLDATGTIAAWTSSPSPAAVSWSADDPESGVAQYEYAVWSTPTGTSGTGSKGTVVSPPAVLGTPVLQPFTAVGGRTDGTLDQITLKAGQPIYVAVRATNGQGAVSATGVSMPLRYDPTPPFFAAGAALAQPIVATPFVSTVTTYAACPTAAPPYPGAVIPLAVGTLSLPSAPWSGTLTPQSGPVGAAPQITLNRPDATDNESGVTGYFYHITTSSADTVFSGSWIPVLTRGGSILVSGSPLDYTSQFYVMLVAQNAAGGVSAPLVYGPFRVPDPSPPTAPVFCAGPGALPGQLSVLVTTPATDPETGLQGYQYRVRTAAGAVVRDWPAAAAIDWSAAGGAARIAGAPLTDGQTYYVDVRGVNQQGEIAAYVASGPVLYDASAPPNPGVTASTAGGITTLTVTAAADPQSGLSGVQWAIGTTATGADVVPWSFTTVAAGAGGTAITLPPVPVGVTLYAQARSVNGAGAPSTISVTSFSVPITKPTSPPVIPVLPSPAKKVP